MYILLIRPKEAIRQFGAGDYRTPFFFFLFFTIILALLESLASELQMLVLMQDMAKSGGNPWSFDIIIKLFASSVLSWNFLYGPLTLITLSFLLLAISMLFLTIGLSLLTGVKSWNPAFTISAYCLPVLLLLFTILSFVQIPRIFNNSLSWVFALAFTLAAIVYLVFIAGFGINLLTKIPLTSAGMLVFFWAIIAILLIWYAPTLVILLIDAIVYCLGRPVAAW
jgi:hypothetical protein